MFKLFKEIKGVFVQPKKKYYLGKIAHGAPYFNPWNFLSLIIYARKLIKRSKEDFEEYKKMYPYNTSFINNNATYENYPMVNRTKHWTVRLFNVDYYVAIGWPVYIYWNDLGWKWKYDYVRFEWCPAFYIFFFKWQFCVWWLAPDGSNDRYYEMILHWKYNAKKDLVKAENTWGWVDFKTKQSTWDKNYLICQKGN